MHGPRLLGHFRLNDIFLPEARIVLGYCSYWEKKLSVRRAGGRLGVTLSFPDHYSKSVIRTFMKFGTYMGLML